MSTHRSISPRRHHKLAGYRLRRDTVTGRYTPVSYTHLTLPTKA